MTLHSTGTGAPVDLALPLDAALGGSPVTVRTPAWLSAGDGLVASACNQSGCTAAAPVSVGTTSGYSSNQTTTIGADWMTDDGLTLASLVSGTATSPMVLRVRSTLSDVWPATASASLTPPASLSAGGFSSANFSLSRDGGVLAVASANNDKAAAIALAPKGTPIWRSIPLAADPRAIFVSSNGNSLAVATATTVAVYDLGGIAGATWTPPTPLVVTPAGMTGISVVTLSADGRWLIITGVNGTQPVYARADLSSSPTTVTAIPFGTFSNASAAHASSLDGQTIALVESNRASPAGSNAYTVQCTVTGGCSMSSSTPLLSSSTWINPSVSADGSVLGLLSNATTGGVYVKNGAGTWAKASPLTDSGFNAFWIDPAYGFSVSGSSGLKLY